LRVKKENEIKIHLSTLKKLIFEKDLSLSDFFRMCQNIIIDNVSGSKTYFNTSSSPGINLGALG